MVGLETVGKLAVLLASYFLAAQSQAQKVTKSISVLLILPACRCSVLITAKTAWEYPVLEKVARAFM